KICGDVVGLHFESPHLGSLLIDPNAATVSRTEALSSYAYLPVGVSECDLKVVDGGFCLPHPGGVKEFEAGLRARVEETAKRGRKFTGGCTSAEFQHAFGRLSAANGDIAIAFFTVFVNNLSGNY